MRELRVLIDEWELVGFKQRELAAQEKDIGLRSALLATANAWFTAAHDLRTYLENPDDRS